MKMEAGFDMTEILMKGWVVENTLAVGDGMPDCFKIDSGMRDEKQKITLRGEPRL